MTFRVLADAVVAAHLAFVAFVLLGGLLAIRWPRLAWVHLPCAAYGAAIEIGGWICPLTPLENVLRHRAGEAGYTGGFVEHYLLPVLYPAPMPSWAPFALAGVVVIVNAAAYAAVVRHGRQLTAGIRAGPTRSAPAPRSAGRGRRPRARPASPRE